METAKTPNKKDINVLNNLALITVIYVAIVVKIPHKCYCINQLINITFQMEGLNLENSANNTCTTNKKNGF